MRSECGLEFHPAAPFLRSTSRVRRMKSRNASIIKRRSSRPAARRAISISSSLVWRCVYALAGCYFYGITLALAGPNPRAIAPDLAVTEIGPTFRVDTWKTEQGLPQNTVKAMLQDHDGYLWLSTRFGIVRFDGLAFRIFARPDTPGLGDDNAIAFAEDRDGSLWVLHKTTVTHHKDGLWRSIDLSTPGGSLEYLHGISTSRSGGVWVVGSDNLFRVTEGRVRRYGKDEGLQAQLFGGPAELPGTGEVLIIDAAGIQALSPETGRVRTFAGPAPSASSWLQCFCLAPDGGVWTGGQQGLLYWRQGQGTILYTTRDGMSVNSVSQLSMDRSGRLWVVTEDGEVRVKTERGFVAPEWESAVCQDHALCFSEDREGNLWVGSESGGLKRIQNVPMANLTTSNGLLGDHVQSISECRDGRLLIGTTYGLAIFQDGSITTVALPDSGEDSETRVSTVLEDNTGAIWLGTRRLGLNQLVGGHLIHHRLNSEQDARQVNGLFEDSQGRLWVSCGDGLYCLERERERPPTHFTTDNGLVGSDVRCVQEDSHGDIWIATYGGGINRLHDGKMTAYTHKNGLSDNRTWLLRFDSDGVLWVGTEHGLNRFKNEEFFRFDEAQGLFDATINDVLEDDDKNFWIGCNRGIFRVAKAELDEVADGKTNRVRSVVYGTTDGMVSSETNGETQSAACRTRGDQLWFPTVRGAVHFNPRDLRENRKPPPVVIEEALADGRDILRLSPCTVGSSMARVVEFHYTGNSLVASEKVRYEYRLDGHDTEWTPAGTRRVAIYTDLPPAKYCFHVKACNNDGIWNESGAQFAFAVSPGFFQSRTFQLLAVLWVIGFAYGLHLLRVEFLRRIQELEKQHALDQERGRIARDMHDELGSSLTKINLLCELAARNAHNAPQETSDIQKIMGASREVFRALDEIVWAANPKHDTLDSLIAYASKYAQDYLRTAEIRCRLQVPSQRSGYTLSSEQRHHLFLAIKEALNNAVKHARASEISLRIEFTDSLITVVVTDNGAGFDPDRPSEMRNGLGNMRTRLQAIGGKAEIVSSVTSGTCVTFRVPVKPQGPPTHSIDDNGSTIP